MSKRTPYQDYLDRLERTPTTEAEIILTNLEDAYRRLVSDLNGDRKYKGERLEDVSFHETSYFKSLIAPGSMGGYELESLFREKHSSDNDGVFIMDEIHAILISLAYCIQALRADAQGKKDLAWTYIIDSRTWFTASLSLKPMRIGKIKKRRAVSNKRALAAKKKYKDLYQPHIDFIVDLYKSGVESGKWTNPHQATDEIHELLNTRIKENKDLWRTSPDNRREWIYEKLIEAQK